MLDDSTVEVFDASGERYLTIRDGGAVLWAQTDLCVTVDPPDSWSNVQCVCRDFDALRQGRMLTVVAGQVAADLDSVAGPAAQ